MSLKDYIPWWGKITAKFLLARLPFSYEVFQKLGLLFLEGMAQPSYRVQHWAQLLTPRSKLSKEFTQLSDEELCVSDFCAFLKPV